MGTPRQPLGATLGPAMTMLRITPSPPVRVTLERTHADITSDVSLWGRIRQSTNALSFESFMNFMEIVLCTGGLKKKDPREQERRRVQRRLKLPFTDTDPYRQLKIATEVFVMLNCGVDVNYTFNLQQGTDEADWLDKRGIEAINPGDIEKLWQQLLQEGNAASLGTVLPGTLPYLGILRRRLGDIPFAPDESTLEQHAAVACFGVLQEKLTHPCFIELIWSYWHEEAMLVQTMNAISWRFQNRRGPADRDPLGLLEIDPLRPLNNFLWGYIQDEQHRLSVPRRAYEYDHHYGMRLLGRAVPPIHGADSRLRFIEAFHNLLCLCSIFYKEDDDTTVVADGFPILNALKEVHLLLTQGAHNQYGDLPFTARVEMLMEEWLLARPEFREFLPRRIMVDYPEEWMDSVETMKTLQGWTDASVLHFRDLGVFGEQVLLGIRFGAWPSVIDPLQAANWARYFRPEIQGYIHAYRAVTGVDLTERPDATLPSVLLARRAGPQRVSQPDSTTRRVRRPLPRPSTRALPQMATPALPPGTRPGQLPQAGGQTAEWTQP